MKMIHEYGVVAIDLMGSAEDPEEQAMLHDLLDEACRFVSHFQWCDGIESSYFGMGIGKVFGVFLFRIRNTAFPKHELLWVIVGDIPPAYLVTIDGPENPREALEVYIELMNEWVTAAKAGKAVGDLIPVNVAPTKENAETLETRLKYLSENFVQQ